MVLTLRRKALDALLLPMALAVVLVEDVIWAGARAFLRTLTQFRPVRALSDILGRLSGYQALPVFLVPEVFGRVGEVWAIALLVGGHLVSGATVYVLVRLVATLLAVFVYHACEPALLRIGWFATMVRWIGRARDWAMERLRPLRQRIRELTRTAPSAVARRFAAMRVWIETRWLRRAERRR